MSNHKLSIIAAIILTGGVAFVAGRFSVKSDLVHQRLVPVDRAVSARAASDQSSTSATQPDGGLSGVQVEAWKTRLEKKPHSESRDEESIRMILAWAQRDPVAALSYARANLTKDRLAEASSGIFAVWADHDPKAAWAWVLKEESGESQYIRSVLTELGKSDAPLAEKLMSDFVNQHPDRAAELYLATLDGVLHEGQYLQAQEIIARANVPNEEQRNSLINYLAGQWARYQPAAAAPWALSLPAGAVRDQALDAVGQAWSDIDPIGAADFAVTLPAGASRQIALRQAISKWTLDDPAQASKWVLQFDAHQDFDQAVASIATAPDVMNRNLNLALNWAGTIQDAGLRLQTTTSIVSTWYVNDPAAALNYLKTSPDLTTETRTELMNKIISPGDTHAH